MRITRIKSFTLSEMIIALVLTVIVVGLAFAVLNLVQKQMWSIEKNYDQGTEINLVRQALWIDFTNYAEFNFNAVSNTLQGSNALGQVTYTFEPDFILREKDTFHIRLMEKVFYFDGDIQNSGLIDAVELITEKEQGSKQLFIYKQNAAKAYLE